MKLKYLMIGTAAMIATACSSNPKTVKVNGPVQKYGTVKQVLFNPRGDADGLILVDGLQISFAPRAADDFTKVITAKDPVEVSGTQENEKLIHADGITNTRTSRSIANIAALPAPEDRTAGEIAESVAPVAPHSPVAGPGPAMPPLARKPVPHPPGRGETDIAPPMAPVAPVAQQNLKKISIHGTVQTKLYDPSGEINGLVLKDDSIVRFQPNLLNDSRTRVQVGDDLTAFGYGTENSRGKFIEATEMTVE